MNDSSPSDLVAGSVSNTLEFAQQNYQYNYVYLPAVGLVDQLSQAEEFTEEWFWLLAHQLRALFVNTLITNRGNRGTESVRDDVRAFIAEAVLKGLIPTQINIIARLLQVLPQVLLKGISKDLHELDDVFFSIVKANGLEIFQDTLKGITNLLYKTQPTGHASCLDDYEKLFSVLPVPPIARTFQQDETFAYLQVAGYNPLMIQRVQHLDDRFPVQEEHYQAVMGEGDSLERAGREGRLYLADYGILAGAIDGTYPRQQKYVYAPLALFAVPVGSGTDRNLRPVAIQCGQAPAENPIITPKSGEYKWLMAKTMVQIADANFHEPVSHLARTHLLVGAFVMATHRQLPTSHPVNLLLRPHFACTLAINDAARRILVAPDGGVDRLLSATIDNSRVLAVKGLQSYRFNDAMLPKQLQLRGVEDTSCLPIYPYRDDALLLWDAIHQWVSDYIGLYYAADAEVQGDKALQAWATEVSAYEGGRIRSFGEVGGRLQTRSYLVDALTLIIFTASVQHAAVNFPQKDLMSYAPAVPMAGYLPASVLAGEVTQQDYLKLLPPLEQAQRQYNLLALLGSVYFNKLGDYAADHFTNPNVKPLLQSFQNRLKQIEATIAQRNQTRPPYEYLLPSRIPQSINI